MGGRRKGFIRYRLQVRSSSSSPPYSAEQRQITMNTKNNYLYAILFCPMFYSIHINIQMQLERNDSSCKTTLQCNREVLIGVPCGSLCIYSHQTSSQCSSIHRNNESSRSYNGNVVFVFAFASTSSLHWLIKLYIYISILLVDRSLRNLLRGDRWLNTSITNNNYPCPL